MSAVRAGAGSARPRERATATVVISRYTMPTVTVKLDKERAARLARWARRRRVSKSEIIRDLIDRGGPIETGEDLLRWAGAAAGVGLGLKQRPR